MNPSESRPAEQPATRSAMRGAIAAAAVFVFSLAAGAYTVADPFGADQGEYAVTAEQAMRGRVIYRDVFCVKPPATYLTHELALRVFGRSMTSIRMLDVLWQAATALVLMGIARRVFESEAAGIAAGVAYSLAFYGWMQFWASAQTDGFLNLPAALAVWLALVARERAGVVAAALSGACVAAAVLFKYPIGLLLPVIAMWLWNTSSSRPRGKACAVVAGFAVVIGVQAAVLAWQGALGAFLSSGARYYASYSFGANRTGSLVWAVLDTGKYALRKWYRIDLVLGGSAAGMLVALGRRVRVNGLLVVMWWAAAFVHVCVQRQFFLYHWLPVFAPAAVLGAGLLAMGIVRGRVRTAWIAATAALVLLGWIQYDRRDELRAIAGGVRNGTPISAGYHDMQGYAAGSVMRVAAHIRENSTAGESVFCWCFHPPIYFAAERVPASRFIYDFVLFGKWNWPELRAECMEDLRRIMPRYVLVAKGDAMVRLTGVTQDSWSAMQEFPALRELLGAKYREEVTIDSFVLFRRVD